MSMKRTFVIATPGYPTDFAAFLGIIKGSAEQAGDKLLAYAVVEGDGCYNHALIVEGPGAIRCVESITMALQPARYSELDNGAPGIAEGQFTCCERYKRAA